MRILLTVHQFVPDFQAGTEILTYSAAKALQARGHEVRVFTGFPARAGTAAGPRFDRYVHDGIPVERFHHANAMTGDETNAIALEYNNPVFTAYFRDYLKANRPEVVHFFHLQRLSASAIDVCQELGLPMVLTSTDFWLICPTNQLLLPDHTLCPGPDPDAVNCLRHFVALTQPAPSRALVSMLPDRLVAALMRLTDSNVLPHWKKSASIRALRARRGYIGCRMNKVDRVTVQTRLMADILGRNGLSASIMTYLPFGTNIDGLSRKEVETPTYGLRVGFIGTLYEHKGAHLLVKAVRQLPAAPPVEVRIYGNSDDYPDYAATLRRLAECDPRIEFCGTFPNSRIGDIISAMDVLVVPSIWYENTPLVIYSAQACGCPVIASNLGGMSEAVEHEVNGLLFEAGNVAQLAQTIGRLARDNALLRRLADGAKRPKSILAYAIELENLYGEILEERREI
jgi:glycosyltransferase involved in cell wall biosynthesis